MLLLLVSRVVGVERVVGGVRRLAIEEKELVDAGGATNAVAGRRLARMPARRRQLLMLLHVDGRAGAVALFSMRCVGGLVRLVAARLCSGALRL